MACAEFRMPDTRHQTPDTGNSKIEMSSLRRPVSLRQFPQLYNKKKTKNMVMFVRYIHITVQNFKAQSVAVVVEISERSNCVKLPDTDSSI